MPTRNKRPDSLERIYWGADVPLRVIRRYARQIAERFQPDKIILFGSHAYGTPHADSDVDLLVIMPAYNQHAQAVRIRAACPAPFPMDLLVRTPKNLNWRLGEGESFHTEIVTKGKILYEKGDAGVGAKGRRRLESRQQARARKGSTVGHRLLPLPAGGGEVSESAHGRSRHTHSKNTRP
jgi:predicted nucleotidyltransferase